MKKALIMAMAVILVFAMVACDQTNGEQNEKTSENVTTPTEEKMSQDDTKPIEETTDDAQSTQTVQTSQEEETAESSDEKITVYLSGPEAMLNKLEEAFEEQNGDVCDFVIMSCGQLRSKVWTESEAGEIQADVIWGSDPLVYNLLDEKGALEPLEIADIDSISEEYIVSDKNYALVNERYITILYNSDMIEGDAPESFADLTDEKYKDLVAMADATQSSTAFAIACALYELEGNSSDYFKALSNNGVLLTKSNGLVPSTIMEGQFSVGIAPHDAFVRLNNKGKKEGYEVPLGIVWPSEGAIAVQRPVAIPVSGTRSEEKQTIAKKFVDFLLSQKAQTITTNFGFVSVRSDIENTYLPEGVEVYSVDWDQAAANEEIIKREYEEIFY